MKPVPAEKECLVRTDWLCKKGPSHFAQRERWVFSEEKCMLERGRGTSNLPSVENFSAGEVDEELYVWVGVSAASTRTDAQSVSTAIWGCVNIESLTSCFPPLDLQSRTGTVECPPQTSPHPLGRAILQTSFRRRQRQCLQQRGREDWLSPRTITGIFLSPSTSIREKSNQRK